MEYRLARPEDLPGVAELQKKYHVSTISPEDKPNGFVATLFSEDQFKSLMSQEHGLSVAVDGRRVVAYAMAASWDYWKVWPLFAHMIADLPSVTYLGRQLDTKNSYQYGPVCVDAPYRGTDVLPNIFEFSRREMAKRFPVLITFINQVNPRSLAAHTRKLGLEIIKPFDFNNQHYYELGYDTSRPMAAATLA